MIARDSQSTNPSSLEHRESPVRIETQVRRAALLVLGEVDDDAFEREVEMRRGEEHASRVAGKGWK